MVLSELHTPIATEAHIEMRSVVSTVCMNNRSTLHEMHVTSDHIHVLIEAGDEAGALQVIPEAIESMRSVLLKRNASFKFQEGVHVTLLPPWHIQVLASFVRDQDRYHSMNTVEDELDQIFRPGIAATPNIN